MQTFSSMEEAFKWFLVNIYPSLPAEKKKGKLKTAWIDFSYQKGISQKRMKAILSEFGKVDQRTVVTYTPD
jgi:hypothetical protein